MTTIKASIKNLIRVVVLFSLSLSAQASNTGGVPNPSITPFEKAVAYRLGFSPSEEGLPPSTLHRFHYQQSFSQTSRWRVITQVREVNNELEYDELRVQYLWLVNKNEDSVRQSAYRVDLRTRKGHRPEQASLIWTNRWHLNSKLSATAVLISNWQFGGDANPGTQLESRFSLAYQLSSTEKIALEGFNDYGDVSEQSGVSAQRHSLGLMYSKKVGQNQVSLGYLVGLTSRTADNTFRLWWSRSL